MELGISIMITGAVVALLCILGGALGGIAVGVVWAYRRASAAAAQPDTSAPDVVAAIPPVFRPKAQK
jgi:hypothetical protein